MRSNVKGKLTSLKSQLGDIYPEACGELANLIDSVFRAEIDSMGAVKIINARLNLLTCNNFSQSVDRAKMDKIRGYLSPISSNDHFDYWYDDIANRFIPEFREAMNGRR